jgi:hypothetical protein
VRVVSDGGILCVGILCGDESGMQYVVLAFLADEIFSPLGVINAFAEANVVGSSWSVSVASFSAPPNN